MSDDPTADFLAREKAILGDDADLFASGATPSVPAAATSFPDLTAAAPAAAAAPPGPSGIDAFPELDAPAGSSAVRVTGLGGEDEEIGKFESAFPDLSGEIDAAPAPKPVFNALAPQPYGASPYPATAAPQPRAAPSVLPAPAFANIIPDDAGESEPVRAWRERQADEIRRRDEADRARRDEMKNKAEKAIDAFYEKYNAEKEKSIRQNKEDEAAFKEKLGESIAKGTAWERITEMLGLENSQSKTVRPSVPGGSDLARMKEILLALRREGDKAPGAAGF